MKVNGREVNFCRTIEANCQIADICEDGDFSKIGDLLTGKYQDSQRNAAKFVAILSNGYEQKKKFQEPGYKPNPITADEIMTLSEDEFTQLFTEAFAAWSGEKPTIETEPVKKTRKPRRSE